MAVKVPIRAVFDGSTATGLAEYQSGEFIALAYGGLGASLSIGTAGQVLKVNSAADEIEFGNVEAILNIDGMTDGSGITLAASDKFGVSDGGTEKYLLASQIDTYVSATSSTLTNKTLTTPIIAEIDSGSTITLDATTDIVLDADGGDIFFKDGGSTFGSATNTSGDLIIKSGTTTALTFDGASVTIAGDLTISGDDIVMGTNTNTAIMVADGTNFNPVVPSGDVSLTNAGVFGIASGVIVNADVNSSAAIADSKLDTISTANKVALTALDLDGGTEIGAAIVDADLFIIDDGAGGTNKKVLASRLKTYAAGSNAVTALNNATQSELVTVGSTTTELDAESNLTFDGSTLTLTGAVDISGVATATTFEPDGDTAASDNAAIGYTSAEGLILTGQGSTSDITVKNDADADVITIATGTTNVDVVGDLTAGTLNADGDTAAGDNAAIGYTSGEGLILTGQGSTNDVTIKNDADGAVISIPTGTTNVTIAGDLTISGDDLVMGTNTDTAILVADGTNFNPVVPSGDVSLTNAGVFGIASGVIVNADVNASAAIVDTKLATISTANKVALTALDLDGGTEIGAAIVDADLFIIDDGAGGTNKKVLASRLKTYAGGSNAVTALNNATANELVTVGSTTTELDAEANLTFDGTTLVIAGTVEPSGDTAAGDNAAMGYTSAEGLILTGQGSTNDVTIKNDADADVIKIPTGTTGVTVVGTVTAPTINLGDEDMEHYDEGTWTPSITVEGGSVTYTTRTGHYIRIGEMVHLQGYIEINAASSPTGAVTITGFPFTLAELSVNVPGSLTIAGFSGLGTADVNMRSLKNNTIANCGKCADSGSIGDFATNIGNGASFAIYQSYAILGL